MVVFHTMEYNIIENMKKVKDNISFYEVAKINQQHKYLLKQLNVVHASHFSIVVTSKASKGIGKPSIDPLDKIDLTNAMVIGDRSNSHTPPFLLTFEIFNKNVHNFLVDSRASSNVLPYSVCLKLNISPQKSIVHIFQLDRTKVKMLGEVN